MSEFFPDEVAHALNLGRGTAAFRARRAFVWRDKLPATFAALAAGELDERRAGVLADVLQHTDPALARAVEAALLGEAGSLSLAALRRRALALLAELDAEAVQQRHEEAKQAADVRSWDAGDGMAVLAADMTVEDAAACTALLDALAQMAKADGDTRPIGAIRAGLLTMLILRPTEATPGPDGQPGPGGVSVQLAVTATLEGLEGRSGAGGEVDGFAIPAAQLRDLLRRVGALGLTAPDGGSPDPGRHRRPGAAAGHPHPRRPHPPGPADRRLPHPRSAGSEQRRAGRRRRPTAGGQPDGEGSTAPAGATSTDADGSAADAEGSAAGCTCPTVGMPPATDGYTPTAAQRRFVTTRDRRCRMPNCGQRAGFADLDHVLPHAEGGATCCTNLCCLCRSHHRLKTFAPRWAFRMDPDGTLHVTSPSGVTRTTRPPDLRPPPARTAPSPAAGRTERRRRGRTDRRRRGRLRGRPGRRPAVLTHQPDRRTRALPPGRFAARGTPRC